MRQLFTSKTFLAVSLFCVCSLTAGALRFFQAKPTDFPYLSWTAWAINDFLKQGEPPQVVFLGSSLMLVPLAGVDADYLNRKIDGSQHHRSQYFEATFKKLTGKSVSTFNFALPGEMPSDAFLITDYLLSGAHQPKVIVYGVGPRDFMDNLLPSPAATDPFRFLSRFGDISCLASLVMPEWTERLNFELGKLVYFYGHRSDLSTTAYGALSEKTSNLLPAPRSGKKFTLDERRALVPEYKPYELLPGQAFFRPTSSAERMQFSDNLSEYRKRYKRLKWDTFLTQMKFFADTLARARQRGTLAVVVAMPITDLNRSLLTEGNWSTYKNSVALVAQAKGATFIDLSESPDFKRSDFLDTVHLHSGGGRKLMDVILERMTANRQIRSACASPARDSHLAQTGDKPL